MRTIILLLLAVCLMGSENCDGDRKHPAFARSSSDPVSPVPEPSAALVFLVGLSVAGMALRRRDR